MTHVKFRRLYQETIQDTEFVINTWPYAKIV